MTAAKKQRTDNAEAPAEDGYTSWLRTYGADGKGTYARAMQAADAAYDRAESGYGARGEALARAGLTASGYGDYLRGVAYAERARAQESAAAARETTEAENRAAYAAYLAEQGERRKKVMSGVKWQGITTTEEAYAYAKTCGMGEEDARTIATLVGQMRASGSGVSVHQKVTVMQYMVNLELPREVAYGYALSCGMSEEEAREMAEAADAAVTAKNKNKIHYY